ncbi:TRAP transporter large permease subunit [uncultured Ruegeria sp.]|uniref:TRAP transporter large permease n=1 Tax=uncultured Ruegeria sp. TaxID=259304 RepID=UPI002613DC84|nr:TRAP transporter large permease subunit [uncultured Ruegeria sp.]
MENAIQAITIAVVLFGLLGMGVWVGATLIACGLVVVLFFTSTTAGPIFATIAWGHTASWTLTALPLFIWMGEILYRTSLAKDMFSGLSPWVQNLPGRLVHVNVVGCGIFAAVSGSSSATTATIGRISLPELAKRGYDEKIAIGTLAGAGTLGLLIPPSIIMIVYCVAAQVSINRLFIAGVIPGLTLMVLFSGYIVFWSLRNKGKVPTETEATSWRERFGRLKLLLPVVGLIVAVIGSIYAGVATATEAAALGVVGALVIAGFSGSLSKANFQASLTGAARTSCMIAFILMGAGFLTSAMTFSGLPADLSAWIVGMDLSIYAFIAVLTVFFIIMGCFLDGISIVVLTTSVILPAVKAVGIDPLWFGIYLVFVVEMAQITPPLGFNLFVIQGLTGKNIIEISKMVIPFFILMLVATAIITVFPDLVTWLVYSNV